MESSKVKWQLMDFSRRVEGSFCSNWSFYSVSWSCQVMWLWRASGRGCTSWSSTWWWWWWCLWWWRSSSRPSPSAWSTTTLYCTMLMKVSQTLPFFPFFSSIPFPSSTSLITFFFFLPLLSSSCLPSNTASLTHLHTASFPLQQISNKQPFDKDLFVCFRWRHYPHSGHAKEGWSGSH